MFVLPDWREVTAPGVGTNRQAYSFNDEVIGRDPEGHAAVGGSPCDTGDTLGASFESLFAGPGGSRADAAANAMAIRDAVGEKARETAMPAAETAAP